ncbi:MAG: hypothetical protein L0I19_02370, partial [Lactococcus lactis]|nr:hypothetical protein [Lactococcus lactis]
MENLIEELTAKNKEYIQNLKIELDQIKDKNEESHQKYQDLLEANQKLELEIEELLGSPLIIEGGGIFKKFANLETENQHNANMALLDEIMVLR